MVDALRRIQLFMRDHAKSLFLGQEFHSAVDLMVFVELTLEILALLDVVYSLPVDRVIPEKNWAQFCSVSFFASIEDYTSFSARLIEHILLYHLSNSADIEVILF